MKAQRVEENVPHAAVALVSMRWYLDWEDMGGPRLQCCRSLRREQVAGQVTENLDQNWQLRLQEGCLVCVRQLPCTRVVIQTGAFNIIGFSGQKSSVFNFNIVLKCTHELIINKRAQPPVGTMLIWSGSRAACSIANGTPRQNLGLSSISIFGEVRLAALHQGDRFFSQF